ncbi:MAG: hypothetical protein PHQ74_09095 [Crocinitomicaceae bacterium]|nr:hypothetical protein [Crocinitomicaceae bacterium]
MIEPHTINRGLVIIIPKQPFYDWENAVFPEPDFLASAATAQEHNSYLLNEDHFYDDPKKVLQKYWRFIFEDQLFGICINETDWPQKLTWKLFTEWFDFYFSSMVIDLENKMIEREEY